MTEAPFTFDGHYFSEVVNQTGKKGKARRHSVQQVTLLPNKHCASAVHRFQRSDGSRPIWAPFLCDVDTSLLSCPGWFFSARALATAGTATAPFMDLYAANHTEWSTHW